MDIQKILLVSRQLKDMLSIQSMIDGNDKTFIKAKSNDEVFKQLTKYNISLILLDIDKFDTDGIETARLIKANHLSKNIPILFIFNNRNYQENIFKEFSTAMVDCILKPVDKNILKSKINIFLEFNKQRNLIKEQFKGWQETKNITSTLLSNISEGVFFLNNDLEIKPGYSIILESILASNNLAHKKLLSVLKESSSSEILKSTDDYLDFLFNNSMDMELLTELNPLKNARYIFIDKETNIPFTKYLSFKFTRIYSENEIVELLITIKDITDTILLEKEVKKVRVNYQNQMQMMLNILHIEPSLLDEFIQSINNELNVIIRLLNEPEEDCFSLLNKIYKSVYRIHNNATVLDLKYFIDTSFRFKSGMNKLKKKRSLNKDDFCILFVHIQDLQYGIDEMHRLRDKVQTVHNKLRPKRKYESDIWINSIKKIIAELSEESDKKVEFVYDIANELSIPPKYRLFIKDILIQLVDNSIKHGIESPRVRKNLYKNPCGTIFLEFFNEGNIFGFKFRDDGRGIQIDKLKMAALHSKKWDESTINSWDENKISELIFDPNLTYAEKGLGLSKIKLKLAQYSGNIQVTSEKDKYCEYIVNLPLDNYIL